MTKIVLVLRVKFYFTSVLLLGALKLVVSLYEKCNHVIELNAGQKIYINSPYYPAEYPVGTSCRYTLFAPLDHKLNFKCSVELNVDSTTSTCHSEVFYFNGEGSEILTESDYFCGSAKFERTSFLNRAVISYISQPFFKRTLLAPPALYTTKHEEAFDGGGNAVERATTSTSPIPKLNMLNKNFSNAFTQFTKLLISNFTLKNEVQTTNAPTITPTTENGELPMITSREKSISNSVQKSSNETSNLSERNSRIVSPNFRFNNTQYYGYIGNRGGGRFSCLVETIEPPCDCGWTVSLKIAGAIGVAGINEFPSMAGVKTLRFNKIFCGATIIHHRYLISAAHCYTTPETNNTDLIRVVVGENDISTVLESLYTRAYEVEAIILHEQFHITSRNLRNDIALLRTHIPIEWNRSVGPACLPFRAFNVPGSDIVRKPPLMGQSLETVGWGTTTFGGTQSTQLLKTTLDVFPKDQCRKVLRTVPSGVFCTFTAGRDSCQYDSGGALYVRNERLFAVGIVSYGFACAAQRPSVNTRIASFIKWIKAKTPDASYCVK